MLDRNERESLFTESEARRLLPLLEVAGFAMWRSVGQVRLLTPERMIGSIPVQCARERKLLAELIEAAIDD